MEPTPTFLICQASMLALEAHGVAVVMVNGKVVSLYCTASRLEFAHVHGQSSGWYRRDWTRSFARMGAYVSRVG